jgi:ubiquitin C-terminal hydrolase
MALNLTILNKSSLYESLKSYIQYDVLEGQNAYFCDQCQKKVAIQKRTILKKLPNVLIIVLNRFDFDYRSMTRVKLNDYFEYPQSLDLKAFT